MTREHECECLVEGCRCTNRIACTPGADWCEDCDEGRHIIPDGIDVEQK